jgi:gamma-glutamylputrescine oxidase
MSARFNLLYSNDTPGEYPASYYAASAQPLERFQPLDGSIECEVCVIGAGFTGLSAGLHLAEAGRDVVILDAHRVGWGASGRNGGHVGSGQRVEQGVLEDWLGKDEARSLWQVAEASKAIVKWLIARHDIECDLRPGILHCMHRARYVEGAKAYVRKLNETYHYPHIRFVDRDEMRQMVGTEAYHGGTLDSDAAHLHPLKYVLGLARAAQTAGVRIFEQSPVESYGPGEVRTTKGRVKAENIVLACNGYLGKLDDDVAARVMPINNFIIATEPLDEAMAREIIRDDVAVSDSKFVINYYKLSADRRLLFGGRESYGYRFPGDIKSFVRKAMLEIYPQLSGARIDYGWGGTLGITMRRMPYIRQLRPGVLTASGYSGHGVAMATLAGKMISDAITATSPQFDAMARVPAQRFPGGPAMRWPLLVAAMAWFSLRDRI